jgi:hypothetical protein
LLARTAVTKAQTMRNELIEAKDQKVNGGRVKLIPMPYDIVISRLCQMI